MKTAQLNQVDNIQQSILNIVNIQNELSFKLQEQGDQINNLMDTHSQVELEVKEGNRTLNKATRKTKEEPITWLLFVSYWVVFWSL